MEALDAKFQLAKDEYQKLLARDFPGFDIDEYIEEKAREANRAKAPDTGQKAKKPQLAHGVKDKVKGAGKTIANTEASAVAGKAKKIGKSAVGVQGFKDRSTAKQIRELCGKYYDAAEELTEDKRQRLNFAITDFGEYRLRALQQTVGPFLKILEDLKQNNADDEFENLLGRDINTKTLEEMAHMNEAASEALRQTALAGAFGAAAVLGIPKIVTGALVAASMETTIASLSGSAANSAILTWIGGGSLASIGGGAVTTATALAAITAGATAVTTILAAGVIVSLHYGKKLTEAKEYEKEVGVAVLNLEKAWPVMDDISKRTAELREATETLKWKTTSLLADLEPLVANFDFSNPACVRAFNNCAESVKQMAALAQIPLLDDEGNLR